MESEKIRIQNGQLIVPDFPVIPFIEGDGTGPDIWASSVRVINSAVDKAYNGKRKIVWREVLAGEKAFKATGEWLPQETLDIISEYTSQIEKKNTHQKDMVLIIKDKIKSVKTLINNKI